MKGLRSPVELDLGLVFGKLDQMVKDLLPNDLGPQFTFYTLHGEALECPLLIFLLVGLLLLLRFVQSVGSRLYGKREKQLADTLAACIEEKCWWVNKLRAARKEQAGTESALWKARPEKELFTIPHLVRDYTKAMKMDKMLRGKLSSLTRDLKEEQSKCAKQEVQMAVMLRLFKTLEDLRVTIPQGAVGTQPGGQGPSL